MRGSLYRRPVPKRRCIMGFSSWLRNLQSTWVLGRTGGRDRLARRCRPATSYQPHLEALEDRLVPSTLTVLNSLDSGPGSLRAEIAAANPGDQIVFAKSVHAITLTSGELVINKSLDIEGPGANKLTVSGNNTSRVFDIQGGATATIAGLTIANGRVVDDAGGGIENEAGATLNLVSDVVANNTAYGIGGGLWNR